ncbi:RTX family exoprotein [Cenarchaeum symbiosum A]|uniref:RTX family exoprotein n=1 Tax=Cenarchaeum symbiosum (strain A) TaxID=414004 RepID=A0RYK1_CENSY|nr:RTX family exoprotein [Cenarchaeum symbiosum A]
MDGSRITRNGSAAGSRNRPDCKARIRVRLGGLPVYLALATVLVTFALGTSYSQTGGFTLDSAELAADGGSITLAFSDNVDPENITAGAFGVPGSIVTGAAVSGNEVVLTLAEPAPADDPPMVILYGSISALNSEGSVVAAEAAILDEIFFDEPGTDLSGREGAPFAYITDLEHNSTHLFATEGLYNGLLIYDDELNLVDWTGIGFSNISYTGVGIDGTDVVATVSTPATTGIFIIDSSGNQSGVIITSEVGYPIDVDLNPGIVVADFGNNQVAVYDLNSPDLQLTFGNDGSDNRTAPGQLFQPSGVETNGTHIFVADFGNGRVQVFNATGAPQEILNASHGESSGPSDVHVSDDVMLVSHETGVVVLDNSRNIVQEFGAPDAGYLVNSVTSNGTHVFVSEYAADLTSGLTDRVRVYEYSSVQPGTAQGVGAIVDGPLDVRAEADALSISDSVAVSGAEPASAARPASDALPIAEGAVIYTTFERPASDAPLVAELASADRTIDSGEVMRSAADALSLADSVAVSAMVARPATDAPTVAERASADRTIDSGEVMRSAADALSLADSVAVSAMVARPATDAPTVAERASADRTIDSGEVMRSAADALSLADSVAVSAMVARPATDAPTVAERASADRIIDSGEVMRSAADALSLADSVSVSAMVARPATDAPTVAERASADRTIDSGEVMRSAADALSIADSVAVSAMAARPVSDAPTVAERASADRTIDSETVMRSAADAPSPSDSTDIILAAVRAAVDAPTVSENNDVDLSGEIRESDAPGHSDRVSLGTGLAAADAPLVSERIDGMRMGMTQAADAPMVSDGAEVMQDGIIQKTVAPEFIETVVRSVSLGTGDAPAVSERETSMGMILLSTSDAPGITDSAHTTPTVRLVSANSAAEKENGTVAITITFSEPVDVTSAPQLLLEVGVDNVTAEYASGSGTTELVFSYTVLDGHNSPDLAYTGTGALIPGNGTISAADDGAAADLTLPQPGSPSSLSGSSNVVIDTIFPSIARILATGNYILEAATSEPLNINSTNIELAVDGLPANATMVDTVAGNNLLITTNRTLLDAQNITVQFTGVTDPAGNPLAEDEYNLTDNDKALLDGREVVIDDDGNLLVIHDRLPDVVRIGDETRGEPLILNLENVRSSDGASATLPSNITVTRMNVNRDNVTLLLPANLTLSGFNDTQQIIIQDPTRPLNVNGTPRETSVEVGLPNVDLLLGMPVEIGLDGVPGDLGYRINSTNMTTVINRCDGNSPDGADVHRANGSACLVNTGNNFTILTYGLSTFGLFIPTLEPVSPPTPTPAPLPRRGGGGGGGGGSILSGPSVESSASLGFASGGQDALGSPSGILLAPGGTLVITPEIESDGFTARVFGMEVILYGAGGQEDARVRYSAVPVLLNSEQCSGESHTSDRIFSCDASSVISEEDTGYTLDASDQLSLEIPLEDEFEGTMSVMLQDSRGILLLSHDRAVYGLSTGQPDAPDDVERGDAPGGDVVREDGPSGMRDPAPEPPEDPAAASMDPEDPMDPEPRMGGEPGQPGPAGPGAGTEPTAEPEEPDDLLGMIMGWFRSLFGG